ncbi:PASTA domain-containing protein [Microbispora hainanensis]|jgi:beta-lactam-binding protein with PASTA domain|uniref:PASTA domain-containing protein n=1 Tax=Microbispora hainanensis TaxID=568844 RepID=A0ABZ1SNJ6_9ACTN|nr:MULTISPECIES: PASTA domain-containing protein [Microbispora]
MMPVRLIAALALAVAAFWATPAQAAKCPPPPNVIGQTYEQAYETLHNHFGYGIVTVPDPVPPGTSYVSGAETLSCIEFKITGVRVYLEGQVPDLTGMTLTTATAEAEKAGFGVTTGQPEATGEWKVAEQTPAPGGRLAYGQAVSLLLDGSTEVPYLIGRTVEEARQMAADRGLTLGGADDARDDQIVEDQSPPGGGELTIGDAIYVVLSEASLVSPAVSPPASPPVSPPASPEDSPSPSPAESPRPEESPEESPEAVPTELSRKETGSGFDVPPGLALVAVAAALLGLAGWKARGGRRAPDRDQDRRRAVRLVSRADPSPSVRIHESRGPRPAVRLHVVPDPGRQEIREGLS